MLSEPDLASIRATVEAAFPDVVFRLRATKAPDGAGGRTVTWLRSEVGTAARVVAADSAETVVSERQADIYDYAVHMAADADYLAGDRVELPGGAVAEVVGHDHGGAWDPSLRLRVKVVR